MHGSDQVASLEPRGMRELISSLKIVIKAFGQEKLGYVTAEEEKMAKKLRAHIKQ
jgi:sialic acid synthase SpsE